MTKREKYNLIRGFLILLILSAVYAGILFFQRIQQNRQQQKAGQEMENQILLALEAGQIREITFGSDPQVTLEQTPDGFICPDDPYFTPSGNKISRMCQDLADLKMTRRLSDVSDLEPYGLKDPRNEIVITMQDETKHRLRIGDHSDSSRELYLQVDDDTSVYLTDTALDEHFSGDLNALAAYEEFPKVTASRIREIEVQKDSDSFILTTPGDDSCSVTDSEGNTQAADVGLAGTIQMNLSNISWLKDLEYHCTDPDGYGLKKPKARIRIKSETAKSEDGRESAAEDGYDEIGLLVGDQDASGNYYVCLEGSSQVHTIRREYLESLAEGSPQDFWSKNYSFVSIGDMDHLDVTMEKETHTLRRVSQNGGQTDEDLTWYVDDTEVSKESFTSFYYACVSVTAQERLAEVPKHTGEPALELHYSLKDGTEKIMDYYPSDQNFYIVVFEDGSSAANINRLYVNAMTDSYQKLLKEAGIETQTMMRKGKHQP